jgi:predicted NAD/FAD-binding protein
MAPDLTDRVMSPTQPKRVAIVGGGCAGVTAFWALQKSSHDVHLFEASATLGGRIKTVPFEHAGNKVIVNTVPPVINATASRQCLLRWNQPRN